jgi:hypothetical protein
MYPSILNIKIKLALAGGLAAAALFMAQPLLASGDCGSCFGSTGGTIQNGDGTCFTTLVTSFCANGNCETTINWCVGDSDPYISQDCECGLPQLEQ